MIIRPLKEEDLPCRVEWMNNPAVYSSMHYPVPVTLDKTGVWFSNVKENPKRCDMVFEDDDGNLVAMGGLTSIEGEAKKGELYIFVNPDRQKEGIGSKATRLLCQYGFEDLNLHKIYLFTNASNTGARKLYEKIGFRLEGRHRSEFINKGKFEDRMYYGLLSNEFRMNNPVYEFRCQSVILDSLSVEGHRLAIVRDDLYQAIGGGNKARKSVYYERAMRDGGYDACVTTGGIQSNHNRAIAIMCARNGWHCHNVYHGTAERFFSEKGNALLVRKSGASFEFVEADRIGRAMDEAMVRLKNEGFNPMYIHGGGHDLPGGLAFVDAVRELKAECDKIGYKPDHIFHASGTGSTQAGIAVGLDMVGWGDVKLTGISVARQKERGPQVIVDFANMLARHLGLVKDYTGAIDFNTDYLSGGYESYTQEMSEYLDKVMAETGIMFDTTYSGKAFYGMMDYIKKNEISGNVLFWHTGGLMNLMK